VTALGWGLNWPVLKLLLAEMPPLAARGFAGVLAGLALAVLAGLSGVSLAVPRSRRGALVAAAALNVTAWMGLATMGLLYLGAGEGAIICYTMPAWTALAAWPVLGERPSAGRVLGLVLGMAGVALVMSGQELSIGLAKLPGVAMILSGAILFSLGTVWFKRHPLGLHPVASVAWQVGLGCLPLAVLSLVFERFEPTAISGAAWMAFAYMAAVSLCLCYLSWFAALRVLPAGVAAIGTLATPLVGVLSASAMLGEPFGPREAAALALTLAGIVLAVRVEGRRGG
jgi:probable blue pigment (indigoidine) exporter